MNQCNECWKLGTLFTRNNGSTFIICEECLDKKTEEEFNNLFY